MCVTASYSSVSPQDSVLEDISSVGRQAGLEVVAGKSGLHSSALFTYPLIGFPLIVVSAVQVCTSYCIAVL